MSATTLRVVLDRVGDAVPRGIGRYALELTRALIETAPRGCDVAGIVPSSPPAEYARIEERLPGLIELFKSSLDRRQLAAAWQHGFTRLPGTGMVHAPSLFAPLYRHDRLNNPGEQIVVTIHDAAAFTHPESLPPRSVARTRAMAKRAERYADAIVVPTHAVADELSRVLDLGDRVRVIAGAVSSGLNPGATEGSRANALELPEQYVLAVGGLDGISGVPLLVQAALSPNAPDVPVLLVGVYAHELDAHLRSLPDLDHHVAEHRIRAFGVPDEADLAVAYERAAAVAIPALSAGSGLVALEAMSFGAAIVHSDVPALLEVCSDAGLVVAREPAEGYPERLAEALRTVIEDSALASELSVRGRDRARAFSWRDAAEKTWQLHADL